ncbi:MAG: M20 family metallo-hydrolase [Cyclobacteriaceae bacterium]|nr:M20 family metallo-hydrolase [Cyclobacteriaceae bacterium]MCK5467787.1 M20 family metallo-hydrolase [Cyclobacteriaceae bacterium]
MKVLSEEYIALLKKLIETPSLSKEEEKTAEIIQEFLASKSIEIKRIKNNIIARNQYFDQNKPSLLLNSHHDTVKPNSSWKKDPFSPIIEGGKLFGLGSNDAGGCLVSLMAAFINFYDQENLNYNLILAASAEEEISGKNGIELILQQLGKIDFAIVGEPTQLRMAIAEKGLMVLDCISKGKSGHAARDEGENAIYNAIDDINWFRNYEFKNKSVLLGDIKMSVTILNAGTQHNVVPDECHFVVDVRSTDAYSNDEILTIIKDHVKCEVSARSTRLQPSGLTQHHILKRCADELNIKTYGSPTLSDQALMPFPSVKIGPGESARSHTADEYIGIKEIEQGIKLYIKLLNKLLV